MASSLNLVSHSPQETQEIGHTLGREARPGDILLLMGELGTGKTRLTQGIGQGLGVSGRVLSPTFVLVRWHRGRLVLYHIDLFRIHSSEEALDLGLEEYLFGEGVCVVEWADRASDIFPSERLLVRLEYGHEEDERVLHFEASGSRYRELVSKLGTVWSKHRESG